MSLLIIVLGIIAIIWIVATIVYIFNNINESIFLSIFDGFISLIIYVIIAIVIIIIGSLIPIGSVIAEDSFDSTVNLVALNDKTTLEGAMHGGIFVTYGHLDMIPTYAYYYKSEDGGIKFGQIPADSTTIYYIQSGDLPKLEKYKHIAQVCTAFSFPIIYNKTTKVYYKLYIPENSVSTEIKLDLN